MKIDEVLFKAITGKEVLSGEKNPNISHGFGLGAQMPPAQFARAMKTVDNKLCTADLFVLYWRQLLPASVLYQESQGTFFSVGWKKKYINEQLRKNGVDPKVSWGLLKC